MKYRRLCGVLVVVAMLFGVAVNAYAYEGTFNSYLGGVVGGFQSRKWKDLNRTANATTVAYTNCRIQTGNLENFFSTGVTLKQTRGILPAKNLGTKSYPCARKTGSNGDAKSWGRQSSGTYYFEVAWTPGNDRMSVSKVRVTW